MVSDQSGLVVESITLGKVIEKNVTWVNTMFSATMINAQPSILRLMK